MRRGRAIAPVDEIPLVTRLLIAPFAGALAVLAVPAAWRVAARGIALAAGILSATWALQAFLALPTAEGLSHGPLPWLPAWGIHYHVRCHGLNAGLLLLTGLLTPLVVLSTWTQIVEGAKGFLFCLLLLEGGLFATFLAEDLFLFYCGWETVLVPMYFMIGLWGGRRRVYATTKFVLFTAAGSLLMLAALLAVARAGPRWDFSISGAAAAANLLPPTAQRVLLAAFLAAFAVKIPVWPLHTWLPDAHVEAPAGGSVFLAGVLLKMGVYGLVRVALPLFPDAFRETLPLLGLLCAMGAIWGGLMSLAQRDIKSLVAYSSVSHMAVLSLGVLAGNAVGLQGALFQMLAHGVNTGCLFLLVGILYERTHSRLIQDHGGLAAVMPAFSCLFLVACLSSLGLPGLAGFPGEFLVLKGLWDAWRAAGAWWTLAAFAAGAASLVLSAAYLLWMYKRVFFGRTAYPGDRPPADLTGRERLAAGSLVVLMAAMGLLPNVWLARAAPAIQNVLSGGAP